MTNRTLIRRRDCNRGSQHIEPVQRTSAHSISEQPSSKENNYESRMKKFSTVLLNIRYDAN